METLSVFNSLKCITLIFCLFTGNIQTVGSNLIDTDKGHVFHATKQTHLPPPKTKTKQTRKKKI